MYIILFLLLFILMITANEVPQEKIIQQICLIRLIFEKFKPIILNVWSDPLDEPEWHNFTQFNICLILPDYLG